MLYSSLWRVAGFCALCAALAAPLWAAETTPKTFTNEAASFSITIPAGWQVANRTLDGPMDTVILKPADDADDYPQVVLILAATYIGDHKVSLERSFEGAVNRLPGYMNEVTLGKMGDGRLGGLPAKSVEYTFAPQKGETLRAVHAFTLANGYMYEAACITTPEMFDKVKPECKEALQTFTFLPPTLAVKQKLELGFYLTAPQNWEEGPRGSSGWVIQRPATADATAVRANVSVKCEELAEDLTPEAYAKEVQTKTLQALPAFSVVEHKDVKLYGRPTHQLCFRMDLRGKPMQCWAYFQVKKRQGYTVLCTAPLAEFDACKTDFEQTAASFAIITKPEFK